MDNIDTDFISYLCAGDESKIQNAVKKSGEKSFIFEERLSSANKLVDEGNAKFKENDHSSAHQLYLQAAYHIDFDLGQQFDMTEEHKKQIRVSKIRILLNICNNSLKLPDFRLVRKSANLGLKLCSKESSPPETRAKFLYRRGRANLQDNNPVDALEDLKEAVKLVPNDATVRELYNIAIQGSKKQHIDADNVWKGKFQDSGNDSSAPPLPEVDLTITDNSGNPIYRSINKSKKKGQEMKGISEDSFSSSWTDIICCRRRRRSGYDDKDKKEH